MVVPMQHGRESHPVPVNSCPRPVNLPLPGFCSGKISGKISLTETNSGLNYYNVLPVVINSYHHDRFYRVRLQEQVT